LGCGFIAATLFYNFEIFDMIKNIFFLFSFCLISIFSFAQQADKVLNATEALRIERFLASDDLKGRKTGTPEIDKAADFIAEEFKKSDLKIYNGLQTYKQSFTNIRTKFIAASGNVDSTKMEASDIIAITTDSLVKFNELSGYKKVVIGNTDNLFFAAEDVLKEKKNTIVFVNSFFKNDFNKLKRFKREGLKNNFSVVFVLNNGEGKKYDFEIKNKITELNFTNVIGILSGKKLRDEFVVFSGHYDHIGTSKPNANGDSIYNGANDDAAGTTAVIMLANYFSKLKNNERTLVFVAFTAEEIGGFGSQYFSKNINADKVVAMFNVEMIGTESKWGKNSAYITGFEKSDFGKILQKNLEGSAFHFEPDPYPKENLFYRSDNATLAALGVPAHTISTSKMDNEPNYHKVSDEIASLDMNNMAEVIKAIALSSKTIVSGKDTPSRVEKQ
jgi:Peptidase family M28